MNRSFVIILFVIYTVISEVNLFAAEFLVHDEICTISMDVDPWSSMYTWTWDGDGPTNWEAPDDYFKGTFHMRYEIISQPTNRACEVQFVIWQDWAYPYWREQASPRTLLNGEGSLEFASSSPSTWWSHLVDDSLDFSRPNDYHKLGLVLWSTDPFGRISARLGPDDEEVNFYDDLWADRGDWFPMTFRITVVAVSQGSIFSENWDLYMGISDPGIQPNYTINYPDEETNEIIITQHEYSSDNSTWHDGIGVPLSVIPSTTLYFRDKNDPSLTQNLPVKNRPATPAFTIDYENEQTAEIVSAEYEYSESSNMLASVIGNNTYLNLEPGTDLYIRQADTDTSFRSDTQTMEVKSRPNTPQFSIDYQNEQTNEIVSSDFEYSTNSDLSTSEIGSGSKIEIEPGNNIYFREQATDTSFKSDIQTLAVKSRPGTPEFEIEYVNEQTTFIISSETEYGYSFSMATAVQGTGNFLSLNPPDTVYFRKLATDTSFYSEVQELIIPERLELTTETTPTDANPIFVQVNLPLGATIYDTNLIVLENAELIDVLFPDSILIRPIVEGDISIQLAANAVAGGSFASDTLTILYLENINILNNNDVADNVHLYPNPSNGNIAIMINGRIENYSLIITDYLGRVKREETINSSFSSFDLSELSSGLYGVLLVEHSEVKHRQLLMMKK